MIRLRHTSSLCTPIYNNFMWNTREDLTKLTCIPMYNNFIRKTRDAGHVIFYFCKIIFDVTLSKSTMSICIYIYSGIGIGSKTRVPLELGLLVWYVIRSLMMIKLLHPYQLPLLLPNPSRSGFSVLVKWFCNLVCSASNSKISIWWQIWFVLVT